MDWVIPKKKKPALPESIRESVERAREKAPPPPRPDPVPAYLGCVYREVMSWLEPDTWSRLHRDIKTFSDKHFHGRILQNYCRILIELSAGPNVSPQEKSKYVAVLRYAKDS